MDSWYLDNLVCPVEKTRLTLQDNALVSENGRSYPIVEGMPIMLVAEADATLAVATRSLARARGETAQEGTAARLYLDSLGISDEEKRGVATLAESGRAAIDPVVAYIISATSGEAYKHLIGKLAEYPIPELRLPPSRGVPLLDLGCNWGRWSIAAARKGYSVTGIDPSLGAAMAARRVAKELGLPNRYVVADARFLPFASARFGVVFSYSVLQHLSKPNVRTVLAEVDRVLQPGGQSLIQMPNWLGIRSLYHQVRRRFREARDFEVRYWNIGELKETFESLVGPSTLSVDCYFGLGLQKSDKHLMSDTLKVAIELSEKLRALSQKAGVMKHVADSVYVHSLKDGERAVTPR